MPATVLITGCSKGGIGHALASRFQKEGLTVFASARSLSKMAELGDLPNVTLVALDVTDTSSIHAAVMLVEKATGGRLDYLVNNAGVYNSMPLLDTPLDDAKKLFDTNFWGVLAMIQAFAPLLIRSKGKIVNMGSIVSCFNMPWMGIYSSSKSALNTLGETLRLELAPFGVEVVTVIAGGVDTHIFDNGADVTLPADSIYQAILPSIQKRANIKDSEKVISYWMPVDTFATKVVGDVLGNANGKIWRGACASWDRYFALKSGL